jgi:hypothetical protein
MRRYTQLILDAKQYRRLILTRIEIDEGDHEKYKVYNIEEM